MNEILEGGDYSPTTTTKIDVPTSTDVIISRYENKLNASIATKTLESARNKTTPIFTKEEWAYLNKKALDESPLAEVKVIAPAPTITLKKGNTEINIKNAAALVQKMDEMYPKGMMDDGRNDQYFEANMKRSIDSETFVPPIPIVPPLSEKTVNKNAYEIRTDVLNMALDWTKFKKEVNNLPLAATDDDVLTTAQKFYKFVENRR